MTARKSMFVLLVLCAALNARAQDFYADHLHRGIANYDRGNYAQAASDLRIAAFGLLETPSEYETALVYQVLAERKLQHNDDAVQVAAKIVSVERLVPVYTTLRLPAGMREELEAALPQLLPSAQLARAPSLAHLASRGTVPQAAPATAPPPRAVNPPPASAPVTAAQAMDLLQHGKEAGARAIAEKIVADDYTNALAQTVLAMLAGRHNDWAGVVEHYSVVRTRRRLTPEETNTFIMGLVRTGRSADANGVEKTRGPQPFVARATPAPAPAAAAATPPTPAALLAEADRMLREGHVIAARDAYRRLATMPNLPRAIALGAARGLNQTTAYRDSSAAYQKLYPLHAGEEVDMFYEAVNRYQMGDYAVAKKILARALPYLPQTRDVELYRGRIERTQ